MQTKSITTKILYFILSFWFTLNSSAYVATGNPTASGLYPKEGITCAANYINGIYVPFGTQIKLPDGRTLYVEDRMHPDYGHDAIDIYVEDLDQAKQWGRRDIYCEIILPNIAVKTFGEISP